jgi:hypothetical protein
VLRSCINEQTVYGLTIIGGIFSWYIVGLVTRRIVCAGQLFRFFCIVRFLYASFPHCIYLGDCNFLLQINAFNEFTIPKLEVPHTIAHVTCRETNTNHSCSTAYHHTVSSCFGAFTE